VGNSEITTVQYNIYYFILHCPNNDVFSLAYNYNSSKVVNFMEAN